jgi:predicted nucleic acid-binding protein
LILVDTSVLIDFIEGRENAAAGRFREVLDRDIPFGISPISCLEVLHGARSEKDFRVLLEYLGSQAMYDLVQGTDSYIEAAKIPFRLRRKGLSVGSSVDCLIAQTAIEHSLFLLHNDSDFDRIARVSSLKMWE